MKAKTIKLIDSNSFENNMIIFIELRDFCYLDFVNICILK
jgi:hypothetical protein